MRQNKNDQNSSTQDFKTPLDDMSNQGNYSQNNYNPGSKKLDEYNTVQNSYPPDIYPINQQYQQKPNNSGLIAVISILSVIIFIAIMVLILVLTGIISFSNNKTKNVVNTQVPAQAVIDNTTTAVPVTPVVPENTSISSYKYVANVKHSIYFRGAPDEVDSNIICEIPLGTQVGFIENTNSTFAKINYNGSIGYVKQDYLSSTSPYDDSVSWASPMRVVNVKHSIYLRSTPSESSDSNIIMEIPLGSIVYYQGEPNSTFYKISYNGAIGYSKQIYLSFNTNYDTVMRNTNTMTVVNVNHSIYLRSSASESSENNIIMEIPVGSTVTYLSTPDSTFYKISYGGIVGYSKQIYLSFD